MNEINSIPEFLLSHFNGNATEAQEVELDNWLKTDTNKDVYDKLEKLFALTDDYKMLREFDVDVARQKIESRKRKNNIRKMLNKLQRVAAILFIPILLISVWKVVEISTLRSALVDNVTVQELITAPGLRNHFFLPDSTEVWLNAGSSIRFPSHFVGDSRTVEIDGEAYFEVFRNKAKPFIVKTKDFDVLALGTAFNICAYSDDSFSSTTLVEGLTKVVSRGDAVMNCTMTPGEQIKCSAHHITKRTVDPNDIIAWKEGMLVFNQTPFDEIVSRLSRWYNVSFTIEDEEIKNYRYTATFADESLEHILDLLMLTTPIDYTMVDSKQTVDQHQYTKKKVIIKSITNE